MKLEDFRNGRIIRSSNISCQIFVASIKTLTSWNRVQIGYHAIWQIVLSAIFDYSRVMRDIYAEFSYLVSSRAFMALVVFISFGT